mgnify:CR=1 FL=1
MVLTPRKLWMDIMKCGSERERAERESVKHADVVKKQENGEKANDHNP